jgi:hypothetical protein
VRFRVLTAASMKLAVFWAVAPYSLVEVYGRVGGGLGRPPQGVFDATAG